MDALREDLRAPTRWPVLDGVRGLAVVSVVLYHALRLLVLGEGRDAAGTFSAAWWPAATGRLALDAFFVLSGFLIVESWQSLRRKHQGLWRASVEYAKRRAARIVPAYYVSLVVLVPLVAPHLLRSPGDLALLAGVQQYLRPGLPSEVNVVYWSLTTEVHFYVLAPLVGLAIRHLGARRTLVVCLGTAIAWQALVPGGLPKSLVLGRVDQFALGAAIAPVVAAWERGERPAVARLATHRAAGWALVALLVLLGVWQGAVLDGKATGLSALIHPLVGLVMAGLLLRLVVAERATFLEHPALRLAGLVSYGVYLFHYPVLEHGYAWADLAPSSPGPVAHAVAVTLGLAAVSFALGAISYVLVERPFLRAKHPPPDAPAPRTLPAWPMSTATSMTSSASSA